MGGELSSQAGLRRGVYRVLGHDRREDRGHHGDGERWGPPRRNIDRPTAVLAGVAFAIALLAQILTFGVSLTPDRYVLVLLAPALWASPVFVDTAVLGG